MRTEKRDVYICEHCGIKYYSEELCREHEIDCSCLKIEVVHIILRRDAEGRFVFDCTFKKVTRDTYSTYDEVSVWDNACDYFAIVSDDTSDEHIKELKEKLIKKATEEAKEYRDEHNQYYEELLKELEQVNKKEEK